MSIIIEKTPLGVLIVGIITLIILCVYSFFDTEKKKPGHPAKYIFLSAIPALLFVIADRCIYNSYGDKGNLFIAVLRMLTLMIFYITFVVTYILAHKRGYTDVKKVEQNKVALIVFAVAVGIGLVLMTVKIFV